MRDMAAILSEQYLAMGYPIPQSEAKYCLVKFIGFFRADAAKIAEYWGRDLQVSNERSKTVLSINYRAAKDSLLEMAESMINHGLLEDRRPAA